ncbi:hypothetical protein KR009_010426, partial [Drosophila setifemur]
MELSDFQTVCPDALSGVLGFQIYTDLRKDNQSEDFQPEYDKELKVLILMQAEKVFLPVLHTKEIDFRLLQKLQNKLKDRKIFLAIVDNTANILYYEVSEGFCEKSN